MASVSLRWNTNMAAVGSCGNTLKYVKNSKIMGLLFRFSDKSNNLLDLFAK